MADWQRSLGDGVDDDIVEDASRSQDTEQQSADIFDCGGHPSVQQPATPVRRSGRGRGRSSMHGAAKRSLLGSAAAAVLAGGKGGGRAAFPGGSLGPPGRLPPSGK
ncbi:unnamed protein product [Closterium sp. NIES-64]|nr:unnamed protein product [Closterium sp. NIES-64]